MGKTSVKLVVFFEEPFWVAVVEKLEGRKLSTCKVTFGAEPKDYEVYDFMLENYCKLKFSPAVITSVKEAKINPKRMQRDVRKQTLNKGVGTKSQQALKLWQEENKLTKRIKSREQKEAEELRMFELKQQKKREKHRGH